MVFLQKVVAILISACYNLRSPFRAICERGKHMDDFNGSAMVNGAVIPENIERILNKEAEQRRIDKVNRVLGIIGAVNGTLGLIVSIIAIIVSICK